MPNWQSSPKCWRGRNTWWFAATLTVLGLFVVLNITLFA
ncbi:hypothetical protein, partial [Escherichia coli]